jgi:hypothetical protein
VIVTGRYTAPAQGSIRLLGKRAGDPYEREVKAVFPQEESGNEALASLWAREKIDNLMAQDWNGAQQRTMKPELQEQITQLGLDYRLMTQFTSFVAVEEKVVTEGGQPRRIQVPIELAEGVQHEAGWEKDRDKMSVAKSQFAPSYGVVGGVLGSVIVNGPPAPVRAMSQTVAVASDSPRLEVSPKKAPARKLDTKLHPSLVAAYDCWQKQAGKSRSAAACKLKDNYVRVKIVVSAEPGIEQQLEKLGFESLSTDSRTNQFTGRIAIEKLAELAELSAVQFVTPLTSNGKGGK